MNDNKTSNVVAFPTSRVEKDPVSISQKRLKHGLNKMHMLVSNIETYGGLMLEPSLDALKNELCSIQSIVDEQNLTAAT